MTKTETPTPETDAAALEEWGGQMVMVTVEFSQKLERQRDEARRELQKFLKVANFFEEEVRDIAGMSMLNWRALLQYKCELFRDSILSTKSK